MRRIIRFKLPEQESEDNWCAMDVVSLEADHPSIPTEYFKFGNCLVNI